MQAIVQYIEPRKDQFGVEPNYAAWPRRCDDRTPHPLDGQDPGKQHADWVLRQARIVTPATG